MRLYQERVRAEYASQSIKRKLMKSRHALAALALAAFCTGASAQQNMKPGLWEITTNMKSASGEMEKARAQMQQQMASMPPEQRKQMEDMMAKQGMKMGAG